jgi:C4-dicarboxylate-binding protein DctP
MVAALGGTPRKLPFKAVQMALARGGVDGQDNAWSNIRTQKFYRYQDYITVSEHSYLGYLVVASTGFWDRLPPDIRTELGVILDESAQQARQFAAAAEKADRAAIEADGLIHVVDLTAAELAAWKTATAVVEDRFRTQIGGELLDAIHLLFDRRE